MARNDDGRGNYPSSYSQPTGAKGSCSKTEGVKNTTNTADGTKRRSVPIIYEDDAPVKKKQAGNSGQSSERAARAAREQAVRQGQSKPGKQQAARTTQNKAVNQQTDRPIRETEAEHEARIRRAEELRGAEQHRPAGMPASEDPRERRKNAKKATKTDTKPAYEEADLPGDDEEETGKKKRKKGGFFRFLLWLILITLAVEFGVLFFLTGKADIKPIDPIAEEEYYGLPGKYEKGVTNILLVGTDARIVGEDSRSDSMIIVSICPLQHRMYLTSVLRDSYVDIPGYGKNRLNHAYQMGGGRLLTQTIEQNFGIRIDGYAKVDFYSFIEIIDAIGGVDINVSGDELRWLDPYLGEINLLMGLDVYDSWIYEPGVHTLTGRQALAYGRIRYIGTDFGRTNRQRTVMMAALKKTMRQNPLQWFHIAETAMSNITTDMSRLQLTLLLMRVPFLATYRMESDQIPYDNTWWNDTMGAGGEVLGIDLEAVKRMFRERVY